ncbi:CpXC domain-containing protein, partial [bacterium]|nr:CpXC domain-containing protein [bacterium]
LQHFFDAGFEDVEILDRKIFDPSPHILNTLKTNTNSKSFYQVLSNTQFYILILKAKKKAQTTPVAFQCPLCQTLTQSKVYRSLNKQVHPALFQLLTQKEVNVTQCSHCKEEQFPAPFQIHDMKKQKMAFCFPKSMEIEVKQLQDEVITPFLQRLPHYEMELFFNPDSLIFFLQQN